MKNFLKFLFLPRVPGFIPDPNQSDMTRNWTLFSISVLTWSYTYNHLKNQARDLQQGPFTIRDTTKFYTPNLAAKIWTNEIEEETIDPDADIFEPAWAYES